MRERIPNKTSSPRSKVRKGSPPTSRFDMAMIMTWTTALSVSQFPEVPIAWRGRIYPADLRMS